MKHYPWVWMAGCVTATAKYERSVPIHLWERYARNLVATLLLDTGLIPNSELY